MRLYPLYALILVLTIAIQAVLFQSREGTLDLKPALGFWIHHAHQMHLSSLLALVGTNLFLVGQDTVMFAGFSTHKGLLYYTSDFWFVTLPAWHFLFVPQSWTLALELSFYLLAPFIVRRKVPFLVVLAISSYVLKGVLKHFGFNHDPWYYRFFPSELQFFVLGSLGYKIYRGLQDRQIFQAWWGYLSLFFAVASIVFFSHLHTAREIDAYYLLMTINIPLIFLLTKRIKIDRMIGELSYPVYMCHVLVFQVLSLSAHRGSLSVLLASLIFAGALLYGFDFPLERWRQNWIQKQENMAVKASLPLVQAGQEI